STYPKSSLAAGAGAGLAAGAGLGYLFARAMRGRRRRARGEASPEIHPNEEVVVIRHVEPSRIPRDGKKAVVKSRRAQLLAKGMRWAARSALAAMTHAAAAGGAMAASGTGDAHEEDDPASLPPWVGLASQAAPPVSEREDIRTRHVPIRPPGPGL